MPPQQPSGALEPCLRLWLRIRVTRSVQAPRARTPLGSAPRRCSAQRMAAQTPASRGGSSHPSPPPAPEGVPARLSVPRPPAVPGSQTAAHHAGVLPPPRPCHVSREDPGMVWGLCGACDSPRPCAGAPLAAGGGGLGFLFPGHPSGDGAGGSLADVPTQQGLGQGMAPGRGLRASPSPQPGQVCRVVAEPLRHLPVLCPAANVPQLGGAAHPGGRFPSLPQHGEGNDGQHPWVLSGGCHRWIVLSRGHEGLVELWLSPAARCHPCS